MFTSLLQRTLRDGLLNHDCSLFLTVTFCKKMPPHRLVSNVKKHNFSLIQTNEMFVFNQSWIIAVVYQKICSMNVTVGTNNIFAISTCWHLSFLCKTLFVSLKRPFVLERSQLHSPHQTNNKTGCLVKHLSDWHKPDWNEVRVGLVITVGILDTGDRSDS